MKTQRKHIYGTKQNTKQAKQKKIVRKKQYRKSSRAKRLNPIKTLISWYKTYYYNNNKLSYNLIFKLCVEERF
jgi:hypothetical protein